MKNTPKTTDFRRLLVARPPSEVKKTGAFITGLQTQEHKRTAAQTPELSLVVPAYNEAERLPLLLAAFLQHLDLDTTEIVVVDDGSTDGTKELAEGLHDYSSLAKVISHEQNMGKGAAVRTGVKHSSGKRIAFVDADNATDLSVMKQLCERLDSHQGIGAVFGSRHISGANVTGAPALRGVMGRVFNHVVRYAAGTSISDTQCGAKVFAAPAARLVFSMSSVDGFAFDVEVLRLLLNLGFEVQEHPVNWEYRPGTKVGFFTPFKMLRDIFEVRARTRLGDVPYVDTNYSEAVEAVADPLYGGKCEPGERCRILAPGRQPGGLEQLASRLSQAGLWTEIGYNHTWENSKETSPS